MRVLHVINIYFSLSYLGNQFKYFAEKGYKQHLICSPSENLESYSREQNIEFLEVKINRRISIFQDMYAVIRTCNYIRKNKIEVVVGHTPKGALIAMLSGFLMRVPKRVYYRHGLVFETMTGLKRWLLLNTDRLTAFCAHEIVCVSPSLFKESLRYKLNPAYKQIILGKGTCGGIDATVKFNPELIDTNKKQNLKLQLNIHKDDFIIGYCGRLVKDKGIIELIDAFQLIKLKSNRRIKLILVGDFEQRDTLPLKTQQIIKGHTDIILTGFIYHDIEYYYSLMNVLILPSYREGFPTSVLEASSMKLPILTTRATGCVDAIIDGQTGFFITHSPEDISEKSLKLIDSEDIEKFGENGRNFILSNFDNKVLWPEIESKLYR